MLSFFATSEGGLTVPGYVAVAIVLFLVLIISSVIGNKKRKFSTRQLIFSAAAIALAFATSNIKLFHLPMGGSVTLFSMLFITLIGYWYGPVGGIMAGVAYGLLQLIIDPYIVSIPQMLIDYPFAFGALGLSGFFSGKKNGLITGYAAGVIGRFVFAVLSGVVFFGMYAPEEFPNPLVYSLAYNGAYLGVEAAVTVGVLLLPPVAKAMNAVKRMATGDSVPVKTGNATS